MQYQINISIDQQSLQMMIATAQNVALVKSVSSNLASSGLPVIWTAFRPLLANTVAWTDSHAQPATVNGMEQSGPTNVVSIYQNMNAALVPSETVSLFLAPLSQNGQVISNIPGNALRIMLSSASPVANVFFDSSNRTFVWRP